MSPGGRLAAQTASMLNQRPAQQVEGDNKHHQHRNRGNQWHIRNAEETKAEAADHINNRVQVLQRLPERRQQRQGVEHPAKIGQWRQHKGRDQADIIKRFSKHRVQQTGQREQDGRQQ